MIAAFILIGLAVFCLSMACWCYLHVVFLQGLMAGSNKTAEMFPAILEDVVGQAAVGSRGRRPPSVAEACGGHAHPQPHAVAAEAGGGEVTVLATIERNAGHVFAHCGEGCDWRSEPHDDESAAGLELQRHLIEHDVRRRRDG